MQHFVFSLFLCLCSFLLLSNCKTEEKVLPGIYHLEAYLPDIQNKKVGIVMNSSSRINDVLLVDSLLSLGIHVAKLFTPEHGFSGAKSAGEHIGNQEYNGIPIISLYGSNKKPKIEDFSDIDILLFDLQDLGIRFYTYISTLHYVLETATQTNTKVIVLDRPHPFYNIISGPVLKEEFKSFIGMHKVPILYGMTIGEYALMIKGESFIGNAENLELEVVTIKNFSASSSIELDRPPSPNLPNSNAVRNYPHLCFFEGTSFSLGRGTDFPFQVLGHPELEPYDTILTPTVRESSKWPKHQDQTCHFIWVNSDDLDSSGIDFNPLLQMNQWAKENGVDFITRPEHFDKLAGTDQLRKCLENDASDCSLFWSQVEQELQAFRLIRDQYRLY